jgi:hypothetical protein
MKHTSFRLGRRTRGSLFQTLPPPGATLPRDNERIAHTEDLLFVAVLLHEARGSRLIVESVDPQGNWHYYPESRTSLQGIDIAQLKTKTKIAVKTIRRIFKEKFFPSRRRTASPRNTGNGFKIGGTIIRPEPERGHRSLWKFGASLCRPFFPDSDPLLEQFDEIELFDWVGQPQLPTPEYPSYCPLDGPVQPMSVEPARPRGERGGSLMRTWSDSVCPGCLGLFHFSTPPIIEPIRQIPRDPGFPFDPFGPLEF